MTNNQQTPGLGQKVGRCYAWLDAHPLWKLVLAIATIGSFVISVIGVLTWTLWPQPVAVPPPNTSVTSAQVSAKA